MDNRKRFILTILSLASVALLLCLSFFGYQQFKIKRFSQLGDDSMNKGSWRMAIFWYSKVLEKDPANLYVLKQLSRNAAEFNDPGEQFWWRERLHVEPNSNEVKMGLSRVLIQIGKAEEAKEILESLNPTSEEFADFNNILTAYHISKNDYQKAETTARKALESAPTADNLKLNLLNILLKQGDPAGLDEINTILSELSADKNNLPHTWRIMSAFAIGRKDWEQALLISEKLVSHPSARWNEKLGYIRLLLQNQPDKVMPYIRSLERIEPVLLEGICRLFIRTNASEQTIEWSNSEQISNQKESLSYEISYAEALASLKNWPQLVDFLIDKNWKNIDYYRHAQLSRAYQFIQNSTESQKHWHDALSGSHQSIQEQLRLATILQAWEGMETRWISLLEELLVGSVHIQWSYNKLHDHFYEKKDTWELYRISQRAYKREPTNREFVNNSVMYSLLLNRDLETQLDLATKLYQGLEGKPIPLTTLAFALYQNDQKPEAYELFQTLNDRYTDIAEIAYYGAVFAAATCKDTESQRLLHRAKGATLLPEELALIPTKNK